MKLLSLARHHGVLAVISACGVLVVAGCLPSEDPEPAPPAPVATTAPVEPVSTPETVAPPTSHGKGAAIVALVALEIKGRAPQTGYSRDEFGQRWRDLDRNGCDQRNDVLRRDLRDITLKAGTRGCLVLTGTLKSPYSGESIPFVRGVATSSDVQIDHVVALSDAWQKGAQGWTATKREEFANDFLELRATDAHTNLSKGDGDAATWLPPRTSFRCGYVARQIAVKAKYGLWVTQAESDAMKRVLEACPDQGLPRGYDVPLGGGPEVEETPGPESNAPAPFAGGNDAYFENCTAARAAGKAPVLAGQPGYGRHLDRDGDGVGCE